MTDSGWFEEQQIMYDELKTLYTPESNEKTALWKEKNTAERNLEKEKRNELNLLSIQENNELNSFTDNSKDKTLLYSNGIKKISYGSIIIIVIVLIVVILINKVIKAKNRVKASWSQIEVLLKRRYDLLPNIVEVVKKFAKHEKETLTGIIESRNKVRTLHNKKEEIKINSELTNSIQKLFALKEAYPKLQANESFLSLQQELEETEDRIADARSKYNKVVLRYQNLIHTIPTNLIANILNYTDETYFKIHNEEKENIKIKI